MIDIGQNDLADSFSKNLTYAQVVKRIPSIITEIKNAIKVSSIHSAKIILCLVIYHINRVCFPDQF